MSAPTPPRRGGTPVLVVAVALMVLFFVTLGATSPRPALVEVIGAPAPAATLQPAPGVTLGVSAPPSPMFPIPEQDLPTMPDWIGVVVIVVAVAAALALIGVFLFRLSRAVGRTDRRQAAQPSGNATDIPDMDDQELAATVAETVSSLRQGMPVDGAVIECWRRLERMAAESGIARLPTQTSQEFTVAVLRHTVVDAAALQDLAELYRQALFSTHQLTDAHRHRAIAALESLSAQLTAGGLT